jgi:putative ubiquitin-RnfH superfamily antitoxin RatB of RatAB toxin-antitoxin module
MKNMKIKFVNSYDHPDRFESALNNAIEGLDVIDIKFSIASSSLDMEHNISRASSVEIYSALILYK